MKNYILLFFVATFLVSTGFAQEKKSRKELKLEKKKAKFETQKNALAIGEFGFAIRKMLSSNIKSNEFVSGIVYVRGDQVWLDEVVWYNSQGESVRLNKEFDIQNYYVVVSENGQKMTASYQGSVGNVQYSFITEIAFGKKPKLQIKSDGIEVWSIGVLDTRI